MFINYNSYKFPGLFDKLITVYTGPDGKDKDIIHVIGNVTPIHMPAVEVNPRKVVLENLVAGQKSTHTVMISNIGDAPMMVSKLTSNKTKKDYWKGQRIVPAGKSVGFDITVTPKEAGNFTDFLMIYSDARNDFGKGYKAVLTGTAQ